MHSIRLRLMVLFIVVTSSTLAGFGIYARFQLSSELELRFRQVQQETLSRLTIGVPQALWDFSHDSARSILAAEMQPTDVRGILILDTDGRLFVGALRDDAGQVVTARSVQQLPGVRVEADLHRQLSEPELAPGADRSALLGKVVVFFSRDRIDATLHSDTRRRVIEILVVDLILLVSLGLSLRMVFQPLARLRDALFELSRQDRSEVEELPETQRDEFGEVIQGFNQTQRKLKHVMERRRQAEEEARAAAIKSEEAYANLRSAQASMLQSEKLASLGGLVAGVAHEINTPVGVALTSASMLHTVTRTVRRSISDGPIRKSDVLAYMETAEQSAWLIMSNVERAAQLIQSFKQVAVDQTSENRREYVLNDYIHEVMASLQSKIRQSHAQVSVDCPQDIVLDGYPGAMAQVLTNLTMNALVHAFGATEGGRIEIAVTQRDGRACLTFRDSGCGIALEHLGRVFDPFFTTRRGQGGTGLGLNIVHNIIEKQFGGTIQVTSELGVGTCFFLRFPIASPGVSPNAS